MREREGGDIHPHPHTDTHTHTHLGPQTSTPPPFEVRHQGGSPDSVGLGVVDVEVDGLLQVKAEDFFQRVRVCNGEGREGGRKR